MGYVGPMFYPRLESSFDWTSLPIEYCQKVRDSLAESFSEQSAGSTQKNPHLEYIAEGRIYQKEILLRLGFKEPGRLVQNNFEISVEINEKVPLKKQLDLCGDAAFDIAMQYLPKILGTETKHVKRAKSSLKSEEVDLDLDTDDLDLGDDSSEIPEIENDNVGTDTETPYDVNLPLQWTEIEFQKNKVFFQFTRINSSLEAEADRILGVSEQLYNESNSQDLTEEEMESIIQAHENKKLDNLH